MSQTKVASAWQYKAGFMVIDKVTTLVNRKGRKPKSPKLASEGVDIANQEESSLSNRVPSVLESRCYMKYSTGNSHSPSKKRKVSFSPYTANEIVFIRDIADSKPCTESTHTQADSHTILNNEKIS